MRKPDFFGDFDFFMNKIRGGEPFVFSRYADGEVRLMRGERVKEGTQAFGVDHWFAEGGLSRLGRDLLGTVNRLEDNYFYGISGVNDSVDDHNFLNDLIESNNKSFVNLWINANYVRMQEFYRGLGGTVHLVVNERARRESFPFFVGELLGFPDDCVNFWEENADVFLGRARSLAAGYSGETFFVSAGPASEVLVHEMFLVNPSNQYIDVGSSLDEFVHGRKTRPYMQAGSRYSRFVSVF